MFKFLRSPLLFILSIPLLSLLYVLLNHSHHTVHVLVTPLDQSIPFIQAFILPYMLWMPFLYGTFVLLFFQNRRLYYRTLVSYNLSVWISYVVYYNFQTMVPRPQLTDHGLLSHFIQFVYTHDAPYNCFPSIHVMSSYLIFIAIQHTSITVKWLKYPMSIISWSIIFSTLFIKQHVVWDVVSGIALAQITYLLSSYFPLFINAAAKKLSKNGKLTA